MTNAELAALVAAAQARYDALTSEEKAKHDQAQRDSFVRSCVEWPKPNYRWENGVKVYASYEDYCND